MEKCPVCGEEIREGDSPIITTMHHEEQYRFCSEDHKEEFEDAPGQYV